MALNSQFEFQLYVAGHSENSVKAIANLTAFCGEHLPDRHRIEVVDVLEEPDKGQKAKVLLTPTLIKVSPSPLLRIVGNLSNLGNMRDLFVPETPPR